MATNLVSALGAGSGIDVKTLAESLVEAERAPKQERIDKKIAKTEAKISGYGALKFALADLKTAFSKLNDATDFSSIKPSNTQPTAFGITASSSAQSGSFSVEVLQTASAQRTASQTFATRDTLLYGGDPFSMDVSIGSASKVTIEVASATPAGMVSAINSAKLGVTAQLINTGAGYQVVISGETGEAKAFSMSVNAPATPTATSVIERTASSLVVKAGASATAVSVSYNRAAPTEPADMATLSLAKGDDGLWRPAANSTLPPADAELAIEVIKPPPVVPAFAENLQAALDARIKVNGVTVTRSTNTINDVIDDVTLDLYTKTADSPARLDLNRDTSSITDNIKGLVTAYNDFEQSLQVLGDSGSKVKEFGGILAGESLLQSVRSQVRGFIVNNSSTPGSVIKAGRDVGLGFDRNGKLTLDQTKLDSALQSNFAEVSTMFSAGTNNQSVFSAAPGGLAGDAINRIDKMLRSTGAIEAQTKNATTQVAKYKDELAVLQERMSKLMTRYMSQFSVMESIVGNSKSTRESLKGSFEGMMAAYTSK